MTATAALAPSANDTTVPVSVISCPMQVDSSDARKRRREILTLQRITDDGNLSSSSWTAPNESLPAGKKQRTVVVSSDDDGSLPSYDQNDGMARSKGKPKPQMKYDPDVPMSKEEATLWRRDQRRKRNRESAAASRQRQRDRIDELESELNQWKAQFEAVQEKIRLLEQSNRVVPPKAPVADRVVSHVGASLLSLPVSSSVLHDAGDGDNTSREESQQPNPLKMISRQA